MILCKLNQCKQYVTMSKQNLYLPKKFYNNKLEVQVQPQHLHFNQKKRNYHKHLSQHLALSFTRKRETFITQYNIAYIAPNHLEPQPIKIEVGAENALQVEISVPNSNVDILNGILYANVHFVTAQKKMKEMKVYIKRREGIINEYTSEWQDLYAMQTMDGAPFRNEVIPIRIQMNKIEDIGCSYDSATVKIQYTIFVSVIDIDGQNYFKEVPLNLYCEKQQQEVEESSEEQQKVKKSKKSKK